MIMMIMIMLEVELQAGLAAAPVTTVEKEVDPRISPPE